jgi:hypothetical protein
MLLVQTPATARTLLLRDLVLFDDLLDQGEAEARLRAAALSLRGVLMESGLETCARTDAECARRLLNLIERADGARLRDLCWSLSSLLWAILASPHNG